MMTSPVARRTFTDAEVAILAAQSGADVIHHAYGTVQPRVARSPTDITTEADHAAERAILAVLHEHRPADARVGEETGPSGPSTARRRWLVDPLCGTTNFAATTPLMSVNVALTEGDHVLAAASADPIAHEMFWSDGQSAWLRTAADDVPLTPSATTRLVDVNCDGPLDTPFVGGQLLADPALRAAWAPRVVSTTLAVAWVAAGRRAAYITDGHLAGSVHFTAGIALCRAAGCVVTDLAGGPIHAGRGLIAAADETTHADMVALVHPHLEEVQKARSMP